MAENSSIGNSFSDDPKNIIDNSVISGKKVVIVEDDVFLGKLLAKHLQQSGMKVFLIDRGDGAQEIIKSDVPDLLVLDIFLPGVNGLDLLESLRKDPVTKNLAVLIVSNTDQVQDRERAKSLNASFLTKALVTPMSIVEHVKKMFLDSH
ncbi:MAG: response regulator [Patescibacteria group bacterium]